MEPKGKWTSAKFKAYSQRQRTSFKIEAMTRSKAKSAFIKNRRATYDYFVYDKYLAGIVLDGTEVKSLRLGRADLRGTFVSIRKGEAWLDNCYVAPYQDANVAASYDPNRPRKLLLGKKELLKLIAASQQQLTIIPLAINTHGRFIKVQIATARGRKKHDKRHQKMQNEHSKEIAKYTN